MDKITLDRIKLLHPKIRQDAREAYLYANNKLLGKGVRLRFSHTLRTYKEQDDLYALGRTVLYRNGQRAGKVTNARGGYSFHNFGLAFDIVLLLDPSGQGYFNQATWATHVDYDKNGKADWLEVADYFKSVGFEWGGDWTKFKDYPHFQMAFGKTTAQLRNARTFIDNGVTYPIL